ncbi:unnamed protein product [Lathyrus oleraceus]
MRLSLLRYGLNLCPKDKVVLNVVFADGVVDSVVEEVANSVVVVVEKARLEEVARVIQPNVNVIDLVPSVTADTELTVPSIESYVHTDGGFPKGSIDRSVLTEYPHHMGWQGEKRPTLKVTSHGSKMKDFPKILMPRQISRIIQVFQLLDFAHCSLTMFDVPLLSAFVER